MTGGLWGQPIGFVFVCDFVGKVTHGWCLSLGLDLGSEASDRPRSGAAAPTEANPPELDIITGFESDFRGRPTGAVAVPAGFKEK